MKNRWTIGRELGHGGRIPKGWHLAWYEPRRRVGVYFPMPLHRAARALRELMHRVKLAINAPEIERAEIFQIQRNYREHQRIAEEYSKGYLAGWRECFHSCLAAVEDEMSRSERDWDVRGILPELPELPDARTN